MGSHSVLVLRNENKIDKLVQKPTHLAAGHVWWCGRGLKMERKGDQAELKP
jgi:hypothetical protein